MLRVKRTAKASKRNIAYAAKDIFISCLPLLSKAGLPESPVPHLLRSNVPPTKAGEALVRSAIDADAEVKSAELKQKLLDRLSTSRTTPGWETVTRTGHEIGGGSRSIQQPQVVLSPLRRLPMDLLQAIFMEFYSAKQLEADDEPRKTSDLPWELGQVSVSRTWTESALSLSLLWNQLPLVQLNSSHSNTRMQLACSSELIRRSGEALLDLDIIALDYDRSTHPVIDLLAEHSERWHAVSIQPTPTTILGFGEVKGRGPHSSTL